MKPELEITLRSMLAELQSSRLVVVVAPAPDPRHQGHGVRCVCEKNAPWYRDFCAAFPSSRRRLRSLPDTAIRRRDTEDALAALLAGRPAGPLYTQRLLDAARAYWRRHRAALRASLAESTAA